MSATPMHIFVCYEPDDQIYADRLDAWTRTNADGASYNRRVELDVTSPNAEEAKARIRTQIAAADIVVCIISQSTARSAWIDWELNAARSSPKRKGLVGIKLSEHARPPAAMADRGAIFVPFRRTTVERAIAWAQEERHTHGDFTLLDE